MFFRASVLLLVGIVLAAEPTKPKTAVDRFGDPLPEGAVARIGSNRLRHGSMVIGVAIAPDGQTLVSCGWDNLVRVWDLRTGRPLRALEGHKQPIYTVTFAPDGKVLASAGQEKAIRLWDFATGRPLRELTGHAASHARLCFTPDGKRLVSAGDDKLALLWDVATGKELRRVEGHTAAVTGLTLSPGGVLATASADGTALVWDARPWLRADPPKGRVLDEAELGRLWQDLAGEDAVKAHAAVWRLSEAPASVVPFLGERLKPADAVLDATRLQRLLADLDAPRFAAREKATRELEAIASRVEPTLRAARAAATSVEVRRRLERVLERAERWVPTPEEVRAVRAVEVLERIGTPRAREVLEKLANGAADVGVTQEAKASLRRLAAPPRLAE